MTQYSGKIIRKNAVVPTQQSASGVWTVTDAAAATRNNAWPVAGVPDPISRSCRFRSSASAYYNRTPAVAGNQKTWTWSGWVKRGTLTTDQVFFATGNTYIRFGNGTTDNLWLNFRGAGATNYFFQTTSLYRDPSAWYHIVLAVDTTQATSSNRVKLYINGVQVTAFTTYADYPPQNTDTGVNSTAAHYLGSYPTPSIYFDGYLTEVNLIDGQQLTPSSFGTTDAFTGAWVPMAYTGTYGTNGFYLNFKDNTSTTTLGYDYSGNSNNWTANNISLTAGVTYDSMLDVPTPWIGYNTDGGVSVTRGNYATWNVIDKSPNITTSEANSLATNATAGYQSIRGTMGVSSGKWYWEINAQDSTGLASQQAYLGSTNEFVPNAGYAWVYVANGNKTNSGVNAAYGATYTYTDVIGVAFDADAGTLTFYKNGTSQGVAYSGLTGQTYFPFSTTLNTTPNSRINCGQRPFSYTPPTGYKSLCTTNLPEPTIKLGASYMAASTYTGTGAAQSIVNSGNNTTATTFQPDFVWLKNRSGAASHILVDSVRGPSQELSSNDTGAETTNAGRVTSLNANGWSFGATSAASLNQNAATYIGWQWKANGASVSNTNGTLTSQVSANTTAGFSVVTYTGSGSTATVGHGLGVAPSMIIVKSRSSVAGWAVYQANVGNTKYLRLDGTDAANTASTLWNNTSPTSSVFTIGTDGWVNSSAQTYVTYCFAEVAGYSKFGSYTGNGSADGPFVYLGFRPRFILVKRTDSTSDWVINDTSRAPYNVDSSILYPNLSNAEVTATSLDELSNGFKIRSNNNVWNTNGGTYIYACFSENPFKYSNAR